MNNQNLSILCQLTCLGLLIASTLGNPATAVMLWSSGPHALHTKGYMRAGGGLSDGETQVCFKAPGADVKYRLGNECEVYGKMGGYYRFTYGEGEQAPYLQYEYRFTFKGPYGEDIEQTPHVNNFVEFGNIAGTPAKLWVGRREYFRRDVHINDYFYMNLTGDGLSLYDVPLGFAKFGYTYIEEDVQPTHVRGEVTQRNHELSLADIETNPGGKLTLDARLSRIAGEDFAPLTIHSATGWTLAAQHRQTDVLGGQNTLVLQYGRGAARSAWRSPKESPDALAGLTGSAAAEALENAETWRLLDYHLYESGQWAMMSLLLWEHKDSRSFDGIEQTWISAGARPTWFLDQHWRLTAEAGFDYLDKQDSDGHLLKLTAAVEWAPEKRFFSRPIFRLYLTHARWSGQFSGQIGTPVYADTDNGWNGGVQMEIGW